MPLPAFGILLLGLVPFTVIKPIFDSQRGGGLWLFAITLVIFAAIAAYGVWGADRHAGNGARIAMLDLRATFVTRLAIHIVFLVALSALGLATGEPMLLVVAVAMLVLEWPLGSLAHARSSPRPAGRGPDISTDP